MKQDATAASLRRLARIEGQVRGIAKMISDDRYCIDIVRQVQATKAALSGLERVILDEHLQSCVQHALVSDNLNDRRQKVEELVAILDGRKK